MNRKSVAVFVLTCHFSKQGIFRKNNGQQSKGIRILIDAMQHYDSFLQKHSFKSFSEYSAGLFKVIDTLLFECYNEWKKDVPEGRSVFNQGVSL